MRKCFISEMDTISMKFVCNIASICFEFVSFSHDCFLSSKVSYFQRLAVGILVSGFVFDEGDYIMPWEGLANNLERYCASGVCGLINPLISKYYCYAKVTIRHACSILRNDCDCIRYVHIT